METNSKTRAIKEELETKLGSIDNLKSLNDLKIEYLGKKGKITQLSSLMKKKNLVKT